MERRAERDLIGRTELPDSFQADRIYAALADADRRRLLAVLQREGPSAGLASLARELAARTERERDEDHYRIILYHNHVPRLESAGLVEYDDERAAVELTARGAVVASELVD